VSRDASRRENGGDQSQPIRRAGDVAIRQSPAFVP
jgi:hypothetical protein